MKETVVPFWLAPEALGAGKLWDWPKENPFEAAELGGAAEAPPVSPNENGVWGAAGVVGLTRRLLSPLILEC